MGSAAVDRPQVRTLDGFALRRTGGYNIYEIALAGMIDRQIARA